MNPVPCLAEQSYDNLSNQHFGAVAGAGSFMGMQNQTGSLQHSPKPYDASPTGARDHFTNSNNHQPYNAPPAPALAYHQNANGQQQFDQTAAAPPISPSHSGRSTPRHLQQAQKSPTTQGLPMELPGSVPPEAHGMRRPLPTDSTAPVLDRSPPGQDARMRNLPGPRQTSEPVAEIPFGCPPRGLPRHDHVSGAPSPQVPRDDSNRSYSPAPPRNFAQGPERRFSPGPERHNDHVSSTPSPQVPRDDSNRSYSPASPRNFAHGPERHNVPATERQRTPALHPISRPEPLASSSLDGPSSPPQSPITNNAGFDFTSGYSRPQGNRSLPGQSPTTAAYPGQRMYQPGRQFS
ncbi:hypothetical protein E4U42_007539 [Claviceps africana]|uniref:Uncharacterized protein n=1 Tax=Claviceps africana TaxID=83212 RepID=A0A8K0JBE4_9HYPO|nr:hypothetical protein E4U42_007539 [Claviceps africana]